MDILKKRKRFLFPAIHFLLSFICERRMFFFALDRKVVLSVPKNMVVSDAAERVIGYVISKLFAAALILFLWYLVFWVVDHLHLKRNIRWFVVLFLAGAVVSLFLWPDSFLASEDNVITYSYAIRFWPEYWHSAYTSCIYAAMMMVAPTPLAIPLIQWMFAVFVLAYLYNRILDSPVLQGKGKYGVFLLVLMPGTYTLLTNPYRTELYALLCMFLVSMAAMDLIDQKKRGPWGLAGTILLCGFVAVWRTEGIVLGLLLFALQLLFLYRCGLRRSLLLFACLLLSFGLFALPQKLGDLKYYGKDYSFINSFPTLKNILSSPGADLSYDGAGEDLEAIGAVAPIEILRYYGMDGYRRYNYAGGRADINQSLAGDEVGAAYMRAYYRMVLHNLSIYARTQIGMMLQAFSIWDHPYDVQYAQPPEQDLAPWHLASWDIGKEDLTEKRSAAAWREFAPRQAVSAWVRGVSAALEGVLRTCLVHLLLLLLIPLTQIVMFFREAARTLWKKEAQPGLAGISFILLGQAAAIWLVMPAGTLVYLHAYYDCSFLLCLVYLIWLGCRKEKGKK